jgi:probable HAF family extracellular repeat protein
VPGPRAMGVARMTIRMLTLRTMTVAAVCAVALVPGAAQAAGTSVPGTDLAAGTGSWTTGVGAGGDVIGAHSVGGDIHGFVWRGGKLVDLPPATGGNYSIANAVDAVGDVVGTAGDYGNGFVHAYEWKGGHGADLGSLWGNSFANAINAHGEIAGQSQPSANAADGVVWIGGVLSVLPDLGGTYTAASYLNDNGVVAGYSLTASGAQHAVVWIGGKVTDLGPGTVVGLNAAGQVLVAGQSTQGTAAPFLWQNGVKTTFGAGVQSVAGLNNLGQVVGTFQPAGSTAAHGFVWRGGRRTDLGTAFFPTAVNNVGQALGNTAADTYGLGVVWYQGKVTTLLPTSGQYSRPEQLNDHGLIAGIVQGTQDATVWQLPAVAAGGAA